MKKDNRGDNMTCKDCYKKKYCMESTRDYPCINFVLVKGKKKDSTSTNCTS